MLVCLIRELCLISTDAQRTHKHTCARAKTARALRTRKQSNQARSAHRHESCALWHIKYLIIDADGDRRRSYGVCCSIRIDSSARARAKFSGFFVEIHYIFGAGWRATCTRTTTPTVDVCWLIYLRAHATQS